MKKIAVLNIKGEKVKDINLNENVWGIEPNDAVLYDAIVLAQNNQRQGTSSTKTRSEVSGGGRKPWRQKGTGRARQGSTRAPHWPGGGVVFGPHPRSYSKKMNKKERRLALLSALSYKFINSELVVIDDLKFETNKYKESANMFKALNASKNILVVTDELDTLPDLGNLEIKKSGNINDSEEDSISEYSSTESIDSGRSSFSSRNSSSENIEIKDASLMAKAISSILSGEES